ncbi:MAG: hypothetical protein LUC83_11105 [Clostridiales bacterium]|nr:hypothetical protein [Clostridiales bacterium]
MYCKNCGKELNEMTSFCPACGCPVNDGGPDGNGSGSYTPNNQAASYNDPYYQQPAKQGPDGFAIASLVLGIVSFFVVPIIGAILAIVFGNKSIRESGMNTMARVGKILGIISLVIYVVVVVVIVVLIVLFGFSTMNYMNNLYYM